MGNYTVGVLVTNVRFLVDVLLLVGNFQPLDFKAFCLIVDMLDSLAQVEPS